MTKFSTNKQEKIREARAKAARWAEEQTTKNKKRKAADGTPPSSPDTTAVKEGNDGTPKLDRTSSPIKNARKKMRMDTGDTPNTTATPTPTKKKSKQQLIQEARERARIAMSSKKSKAAPRVESSTANPLPSVEASISFHGGPPPPKPLIKPSSTATMVSVTKKSNFATTPATAKVVVSQSLQVINIQKKKVLQVEAESEERVEFTPQLISPQSDADERQMKHEELFDERGNMENEADDGDSENVTATETKKTSLARKLVKFVGLASLIGLFFPAYYIVNPNSSNQLVLMSGDIMKNMMGSWSSAIAVEGENSLNNLEIENVGIDPEVSEDFFEGDVIGKEVPTAVAVEL